MSKIAVYPVALGPKDFPSEIFAPFYPLGCLTAYAKAHHDGELLERFSFGRITPLQETAVENLLAELPAEPAVILLSSYVWNHAVNLNFANDLKRKSPGSVIVIGGPHVPREPRACKEFFGAHPSIDVAVRHEGELTLAELLATWSHVEPEDLSQVDLSSVAGLSFRKNGDVLRTPDRGRTMELELYPSPYTSGEFDHWIDGKMHMPLETNRGCPYGCSFCDWGAATLSKVARMTMERVLGDLDYMASKRINAIGICDANFGILPRDVEIAKHLVELKEHHGYPQIVGYSNAKTATPRLMEIVELLYRGGLIRAAQVSMQTVNQQVLTNVARANIKTSEYEKLIDFYHRSGFLIISELMIGLPGQTLETTKADLQFVFDRRINACVFATSVMPNAPMGTDEYRTQFGVTTDPAGMVESTYSFTRDDYARMFALCLTYKLLIRLGIVKYVLYFVQIEHGVRAMDLLARWLERAEDSPELYPVSHQTKKNLLDRPYQGIRKDWLLLSWDDQGGAVLFDALDAFYAEILALCEREFGVRVRGSDVDAIVTANRELIPRKGAPLPARIELPHDVVGYFAALREVRSLDGAPAHVPLAEWPPGTLEIAPRAPCTSYQYVDLWVNSEILEVSSNLRI